MSREPIISVKELTAGYGDETVLQNISFDVYPGEVFIILGGSGCGKSTLLKNMIGLMEPMEGQVIVCKQNIHKAQGRTRHCILREIGVMYQSGALFGSMTLLDNIILVLEEFTNLPQEAMERVALAKLNLVGLGDSAGKSPSELSGGMKKRAAIARAMALDPKILFLDEPSAGLDPVTSAQMDELILQLEKSLNITFVIVTHELSSIYNLNGRSIMLDRESKQIIAMGRPDQLKNSEKPQVAQFFNRQAQPA